MAICPKCKKTIDCLSYNAVIHTGGTFQIDDGFSVYDEDYIPLSEAEFTFDCPECGEELFIHGDEAEDFLTGVGISCPSGQV